MNNRNVLYMNSWIKDKTVIQSMQNLSNAVASMKATNDFHKGIVDNCHPKHSPESHAYMKKYNELRNKNGLS